MKNDTVIQSNIKRTTLANLIIWLEKSEERAKSTSELIRTSLEVLEEQIMKSGVSDITQTDEAIKIVDAFTNGNFNPSGRNKRNLYCNLTKLPSVSSEARKQQITKDKEINQEEIARIIKEILNKNPKEEEGK